MPVQTAITGFRFIDTYNHIREDLQAGRDCEEELDNLEQQQGVPQFTFSSSIMLPFPTTTPQTPQNLQQVTTTNPSPSPSPSPSPPFPSSRSYTPSPQSPAPLLPHCPPSAATQPCSQLTGSEEEQLNSFLGMDLNASFLEELMGRPEDLLLERSASPSTTFTPLTPLQLPPALSPAPTTTTTTSYVAAAGCTVLQTSAADQQLLTDVDMVDFYDLDKNSFYDDLPAVDSKVKETLPFTTLTATTTTTLGNTAAADRVTNQMGSWSGSGSCLRELGTLVGSEQEDLLSAFDTLRWNILQDCKLLSLSSNPKMWSAQDSQAWVTYMLDKSLRSDDCSASLAVPGPTLCQRSEEQLLWVSPNNGSFLRQQLDLWLAVADLPALTPKQQQSFSTQLTSPQCSATLSHLPPSVSPAPSTDSVCNSDHSSSSSSLSSPSGAEMTWYQESSESEDLFNDSNANLSPPEQSPRPSSKTTPTTPVGRQAGSRGAGKQIRLWEFLKELLELSDPSIKWLDQARGIFKIEDSNRVAHLWGQRKNHPAMNYDKLSRSVRQYYKKGIIKKTTQTRRLVYQFCDKYL